MCLLPVFKMEGKQIISKTTANTMFFDQPQSANYPNISHRNCFYGKDKGKKRPLQIVCKREVLVIKPHLMSNKTWVSLMRLTLPFSQIN